MLNNFLFKFELKKVVECLWHTPGQGIIVEVVELVGLLAIMTIITNNPNHLLMLNTSLVSFDNFHHFALSCKLMLRTIVCHFPTLSADLLLSGCLSSCYIPSSSTSVRSIHFECLFEGLWNHRSRGPQTRIAFLFSQASLTTPCSPPFGFSFRLQSSPRFSMTLILISLHTWEKKTNMSGLISRKSVREWDRAVSCDVFW